MWGGVFLKKLDDCEGWINRLAAVTHEMFEQGRAQGVGGGGIVCKGAQQEKNWGWGENK